MKTQEKNFDGIKLSGFTAILIMLALTGQPYIYYRCHKHRVSSPVSSAGYALLSCYPDL